MSSSPHPRSYDMGALDSNSELPRLEQQARVALELELAAPWLCDLHLGSLAIRATKRADSLICNSSFIL